MKRRLALVVGINDYPGSGNDLHGCVNDANAWASLLNGLDYSTIVLLDEDATRANVENELRAAMQELHFGDRFVFTYSGHGSYVADTSGDEDDQRDEALVLHDWQNAGFLVDDELGQIMDSRHYGSRVVTISDSCFSGTVSRFLTTEQRQQRTYIPAEQRKARFFNPAMLPERPIAKAHPARKSESVLLSGCDEHEVSYDAVIGGVPQGAFSSAALSTFEEHSSISAWHERIRGILPSNDYPQTPQLRAEPHQKRWTL